jgi:Autoinducer binding domain
MENWQEDMLNMMVSMDGLDELEVFQRVKKAAQALGFEHVAYGMRLPLPITNPKIITLNSYSSSWQKRYEEENYLSVDPAVHHGLRSCEPLVWSQETFRLAPQLWDDAQGEGLNFGWSQSNLDTLGLIGASTFIRANFSSRIGKKRNPYEMAGLHGALSAFKGADSQLQHQRGTPTYNA